MDRQPPVHEGQVLRGPLFGEPMRVEAVRANGTDVWELGLAGTRTERYRRVTLTREDLGNLTIADTGFGYAGDGRLLRLGLQAYSLGIAYEFDPFFGLSISRVDPLPHQLEAVYDHLLKLARVRFLLADDAGAGKTIMCRDQQGRGAADGSCRAGEAAFRRRRRRRGGGMDGARSERQRPAGPLSRSGIRSQEEARPRPWREGSRRR